MRQQSLTWVSLELHEPTTTKQTEAVLALTIVAFAELQTNRAHLAFRHVVEVQEVQRKNAIS